MAQGTHNTNRPQLLEDLDALITSRALRPAKVKLGGRYWTVKRDFTAEQILQFHLLVSKGKGVEAMAMVVGKRDGADLFAMVDAAPIELITPALRRLYQLAGLLKRVETTDDAEADPADARDNADNNGDQGEAEDTGEGESSAS